MNKQGNITGIQRYGRTGASSWGRIDNLGFSRDGNRLSAVTDSGASPYGGDFDAKAGSRSYDANGSMTYDSGRGINSIIWNEIGLPKTVSFSNGSTNIFNRIKLSGMKWLFQISLFLLIVSCSDYKREMFYCPIEMQCPYVIINVTNGVDTMKCMTATCTLYESMNVQPFSNFIEFSDFLYTNLYSKGKPLLVSCDYYDKLKKEEIQEVPKIKAVFEERGIEGLLSEYPEGYQMVDLMVTDYASFKYLIYLCWLNDIFWFIPEPSYIAVYWSKDWIIKDTKWKTTINKLWYLYKSDNSIRKLKGEMIHRM